MNRLIQILISLGWMTALTDVATANTFSETLTRLQAELAANPTNTTVLLELGDLCHDEGVKDNHEAVKLAEKYFIRLLASEPTNALGRALYGSTLTMKGRDAFWPTTRVAHVKEGIKEMDAAVNLAPQDPAVRFVRANNNYFMPKWLGREEIVRSDYAWLWDQIRANPNVLKLQERQVVALRQGLLLKKHKQNEEAIRVWQAGLGFDPQSALAAEIRKQLDRALAHEKK